MVDVKHEHAYNLCVLYEDLARGEHLAGNIEVHDSLLNRAVYWREVADNLMENTDG